DSAWPVLDETPRKSPFAFLGYTLDAQQRPTFRYAVDGIEVEDFFTERRDPAGKLYLERTLKIPAPPAGLYFRVAVAKVIEPRESNAVTIGKHLLIRLTGAPHLREANGTRELLLPVRREMQLEYHLAPTP